MTRVRHLVARAAGLACVVLAASACQAASASPARTFVDELAALMPVVSCIDLAAHTDRAANEKCLADAGIVMNDLRQEFGAAPRPLDIVPIAYISASPPGAQLGLAVQQRALSYARCIEAGALKVPRSTAKSEARFREATLGIEASCVQHLPDIEPILRGEPVPPEDSARYLLSTAMGGLTMTHYARTRGWYPKSLEICVRYGDGRSPSPACAERRMPPVVAPPSLVKPHPSER